MASYIESTLHNWELIRQGLFRLALVCVVLALFMNNAFATSYDVNTNKLSIDAITIGDTTYTNVVVTVGSVISVGGASKNTVSNQCLDKNFTSSVYGSIIIGMTLDQVTQIVGCKNNPTGTFRSGNFIYYYWNTSLNQKSLTVIFNSTSMLVALDGADFKFSMGF